MGSSALGPDGDRVLEPAKRLGASVVQRHGSGAYLLPHLIDHAASVRRLREDGCDRVLAISSVGSLNPDLGVGSMICPHDYIALGNGDSTFEDERGHGTRDLAGPWRDELLEAWTASSTAALIPRGVYWQSRGPRFETPAEVELIRPHAAVVGMTIASECIAAQEHGLEYAAVCVVDNLANGLRTTPLTLTEFEQGRAANARQLGEALAAVLPSLLRGDARTGR